MESVWWALARLFERGLLYRGHKVVWWWAQGGTVLSAAEVGEGYRSVDDPSVYVRLPLRDEPDTSLLVWTTTPWTLPSNSFAAVRADVDYAVVRDGGARLVVAAALREALAEKVGRELTVERTLRGTDLVGRRYRPPFDWFAAPGRRHPALLARRRRRLRRARRGHRRRSHRACLRRGRLRDACAASRRRSRTCRSSARCAPTARFDPELAEPAYAGRWVKEADRDLVRALQASAACSGMPSRSATTTRSACAPTPTR